MASLWDRLFKNNLDPGDSGIAIHGFNALVRSYARGDVTRAQIASILKDGGGNPVPADELSEAGVLLDLIDSASNKTARAEKTEQILDALHLAELGWITKAQARAKLGV